MIYLQGMRDKAANTPKWRIYDQTGRESVPDRRVDAVWSFFSVYVFFFLLSVCAHDHERYGLYYGVFCRRGVFEQFRPRAGDVALNYNSITADVKWVLMFNMVLGRLEIFTLLVLLTPAYWRR